MPRNPHKRPCAFPGCRAWAVRGGQFCASHRRQDPPATSAGEAQLGPPGLYAAAFSPAELARLTPLLERLSLDDEIWMVRMINDRLLRRLTDGPVDDDLLLRLARLLYSGSGQVARLLRDRRAISGDAEAGFAQAMGRILDELNTLAGWEVPL
ncbi:MAG: hypothetical protein GX605_10430 [Chloroflexi bacterium]|nr:hypothetical protein [Chloroflexota bacterium]